MRSSACASWANTCAIACSSPMDRTIVSPKPTLPPPHLGLPLSYRAPLSLRLQIPTRTGPPAAIPCVLTFSPPPALPGSLCLNLISLPCPHRKRALLPPNITPNAKKPALQPRLLRSSPDRTCLMTIRRTRRHQTCLYQTCLRRTCLRKTCLRKTCLRKTCRCKTCRSKTCLVSRRSRNRHTRCRRRSRVGGECGGGRNVEMHCGTMFGGGAQKGICHLQANKRPDKRDIS